MNNIVELNYFDEFSLNTLDFIKILEVLEEKGSKLYWSLLSLEDVRGGTVNVLELEEKVNKSISGLHFTWDSLKKFSLGFHQIIDACFVGCVDESKIPRDPDRFNFLNCSIVIEMIDGSIWHIESDDVEIINKLRSKFSKYIMKS